MNKLLISSALILIIILISALGYFIFQNQKLIGQLSKNPPAAESPTPTPASSPTQKASPSPEITVAITQNAIKTNIAAKNYQGLIPYMASTIEVILQSTECCGAKTPAEVIDQMSYIDDGLPFNFDQNQDTIKNLKAKNSELSGKFIGISVSKEHLVAFGLDNENKIADIRMSVSWKLFSY